MLDQLSKNITRCGLSNSTLNYLRVSMWEVGGTQLCLGWPCLVLSAARHLAALGCGEAVGQALQEGSCSWAAESRGAVGLPEPTGSQHGLGQCSTDGCPTEGLLLRLGASQSNPVSVCSLQLCVILEPMQELMSRHKTYSLSPRDCLKTCLFQKWQRMVAPPGESHAACCAAHGPPVLPAQALPLSQPSASPRACPWPHLVRLGVASQAAACFSAGLPSLWGRAGLQAASAPCSGAASRLWKAKQGWKSSLHPLLSPALGKGVKLRRGGGW